MILLNVKLVLMLLRPTVDKNIARLTKISKIVILFVVDIFLRHDRVVLVADLYLFELFLEKNSSKYVLL
mgnify:CR=1 FL=1